MKIKAIIITAVAFATMNVLAADGPCGSKPAHEIVKTNCPECAMQKATITDPNTHQVSDFDAWCVTNGATMTDQCLEFGGLVPYDYVEWDGTCVTNGYTGCNLGNPDIEDSRSGKQKILGSCPLASIQSPVQFVSAARNSREVTTSAKSSQRFASANRAPGPASDAGPAARMSRQIPTE